MKIEVDVEQVLAENRRYHDEVESCQYDSLFNMTVDSAACKAMVDELERVLAQPLPAGGTVLDVGTGTGNVAIKLARSGRFDRVLGADISEKMMEKAAANAQVAHCQVEFFKTDMIQLPLADASVDFVVGCAILHHLPGPVDFMKEVRRVLKPGGQCVFIGEPAMWMSRVSELLKAPLLAVGKLYKWFKGREARWNDHVDVHTFSMYDIEVMTKGFDNVRIRPEGFSVVLDDVYSGPIRLILGAVPGVVALTSLMRKGLLTLDDAVLNRILPNRMLATVKFAATRPADPAAISMVGAGR
jgi:ubiquinone/menaquinone biosynthesis C-methylase UbiE